MEGYLVNAIRRFFLLSLICLLTSLSNAYADSPVTIYTAKKIITMNTMQPEATAVAIKDKLIYSVGSLEQMKTWLKPGSYTVNTSFANDIITPGMIEAHCHWTLLVTFLGHPYVGYFDFLGFNAEVLPGAKTKAEVLAHLKAANQKITDPTKFLIAWNYDPIFFNNEDLTAADLDQVSTTRPIFVLNASEHIAYVNTPMLKKGGYSKQTKIEGVLKDKDGNPNGVLKEIAAMTPVLPALMDQMISPERVTTGVAGAGKLAQRVGLTTVSDLFFGGPGEALLFDAYKKASNDPQYPVRVVLIYNGPLLAMLEKKASGQGVAYLNKLSTQETNKLRIGGVKFVTDGSIQGFTARLNWPGYFNGAPNGIVNLSTADLKQAALPFWKAGFPLHIHVNGNQATDSALDALAYLQTTAPRDDGVYVLEHNQMANPEQYKRARRLGAYANIFANHVYYWGDQHYSILLGPDRANTIDDAAQAKRSGILFSLHTDSPVTSLGPLHSMWAAVNRVTVSGRVLGEKARISPEDALRAVTLNAAYLLNLQNEVGSIEIGKRADFTVLGRDPLTEPHMTIKDIPIIATLEDGVVFPVN